MTRKNLHYRQCHLEKSTSGGKLHQTSWLPEPFARVGQVVRLREEANWVDGWLVTTVSDVRFAESMLPDAHEAIKSHRKATGDSTKRTAD